MQADTNKPYNNRKATQSRPQKHNKNKHTGRSANDSKQRNDQARQSKRKTSSSGIMTNKGEQQRMFNPPGMATDSNQRNRKGHPIR